MLSGLKKFNLPEIEERVLKFWKDNQIFEKTIARRRNSANGGKIKNFVFFEGPPTANGQPGVHHVLARVFKDIILRYKTMRGFLVSRRAGWDTQGLPVEIEMEKELGIKTKQEIEKLGIAEFNQKARESVWKYKQEWERLTERIGFWLDFERAYVTYANDYLETLWWIFREIDKRKLLKKALKVVPYCPRCQTALSSHELGQPETYRLTRDPSVFVKLEIKNKKSKLKNNERDYLLIWTTTPWTLPANAAVAVNPKFEYRKYKVKKIALPRKSGARNDGGEYIIWSAVKPPKIEGVELEEIDKKKGKDLVGWKYEPLYENKGPHKVYAAGFISAEEGTGLVHVAPAFGEDDFNLMAGEIKEEDIPVTVDGRGRISGKNLPGAGKSAKEADEDILADLEKRRLLYYRGMIEHEYPFCWRCAEPLLYMARRSWFIEMSKLRSDLQRANQKINWIPNYLKKGRFGNWLAEVKDWAISRERYWGTPLPIWECQNCRRPLVIGGLDDLKKYAARKNRFWIMRHGEAIHNCEQTLAGDLKTDHKICLTPLGIKQAEKTAETLKEKKIDLIYCSPFQRTRQTCEVVGRCVKASVNIDERIKELDFGVLNDKSIEDFRKFYTSRAERFTKRPEGGENWRDLRKRVASFIVNVNRQHRNKNILIISHGDPLWFLEGIANNWSDEELLRRREQEGGLSFPTAGLREIFFQDLPRDQFGELDLHRPYVDEVELRCPKCSGTAKRVSEVADVWFDSGAMPFAQWHYPFENKEVVDGRKTNQFPADYICEAMDQTRGWFYTLLAISVLLKRGAPYKNVISLGLLVDKHGQKMSKSKGNTVDSWNLLNKYGADALRWYFYTINQPGDIKKFDETNVSKVLNQVLATLYNSYKFWEIYAFRHPEAEPKDLKRFLAPIVIGTRNDGGGILDKWILARLSETTDKTTEHLDKYQIYEAAKEIEKLINDLSRWYIRRSRKRFQQPTSDDDWREASAVLRHALLEISKLIAPFAPFFAEALYKGLQVTGYKLQESVHLEDYPEAKKQETRNKKQELLILKQMEEIRRLASLALAARADAGIRVRQPLALLKIKNQKSKIKIKEELLKILADEVNVKKIVFDSKLKEEIELDTKITATLKKEGRVRELTRLVQGLRQDAGLEPKDKITLYLRLPDDIRKAVAADKRFKKTVGADLLEFKKTDKFDAELETKLENENIWLAMRKI